MVDPQINHLRKGRTRKNRTEKLGFGGLYLEHNGAGCQGETSPGGGGLVGCMEHGQMPLVEGL